MEALMDAWNVPEAKARLSEILRRARAGQPQTIGSRDPCVVVSSEQFAQMQQRRHLGRWLLANAPEIGDLELPTRRGSRPDPFDDAAE
jgi:prevent-host-death family protein